MRILHLTTSYPETDDGAGGIFVKRLAAAQQRAGHDVAVLTPASDTAAGNVANVQRFSYAPRRWQKLAQKPGGIPQALRDNRWNYILVPAMLLMMAVSLLRCAKQYDVIQAHWSICGAVAAAMRLWHQKPVVSTLHGADANKSAGGGLYSKLHGYALKYSKAVISVSESIYVRSCETDNRCTSHYMVPNGVEQAFFDIEKRLDNTKELRILSIGSLIPRKGYDITLGALGALGPELDWAITIVGEGPEKESLMSRVEQDGIADKVKFLGEVGPNRVVDLMSNADVLLLTSHSEGRPSVVLEAMASGLAVIATDIEGTRELVKHDETGWLFPASEVQRLGSLLKKAAYGGLDVVTAGNRGRQWMLEQGLTWDFTSGRYLDIYSKLVDPVEQQQ